MNKQQLANKIWEAANKMRSKIEANEYKDYILGFIFYKYLTDQEVKFLRENDLAEIEVAAPSDESEAQKIGTIFRSIDHLITLHQYKLEKMRNIKTAMLEKMFV